MAQLPHTTSDTDWYTSPMTTHNVYNPKPQVAMPPPDKVNINFAPDVAQTIKNAILQNWDVTGMILKKNVGGIMTYVVILPNKQYKLFSEEYFMELYHAEV